MEKKFFWYCLFRVTFCFCSLTKDKKQRPKYAKLKNHLFIKKYETVNNVNVGEWYVALTQRAEDVASKAPSRYVAWLVSIFFITILTF